MEDRAIIQKILSGDLNAFETIVNTHQKLVSHVVFKMVRQTTDREEVCQDVFIKVYENLKSFQFNSKLSTWIARIAYNSCLNYLQKKKLPLYDDAMTTYDEKENNPISDSFSENIWGSSPGPEDKMMRAQVSEYLKTEIGHLPVQYRTIITLYHLDEMSYQEIGQVLNLPEGTVKSYLFRARKMLKDKLLAKYQEEELMS
ncbi:sigma-70 family RNA polymerase sigma factor [bacterium]|nr:sigma-70 family RNA polymerase sigma factor [bacterium]